METSAIPEGGIMDIYSFGAGGSRWKASLMGGWVTHMGMTCDILFAWFFMRSMLRSWETTYRESLLSLQTRD